MATSTTTRVDESDYDSSSTVPDSTRSWLSNFSFSSRRRSSSVSVSSSATTDTTTTTATATATSSHAKPHKANHAAWEAISGLRRDINGGQLGLHHFRLLRRLGGGDIGNVYLCQIRNPLKQPRSNLYAMKVVDREALSVRNKLQRAEMEKQILSMLDHPFLPTLYADFDASHYSCLLMEFCPGGDLYASRLRQPRQRFSIQSAKFYAAETLLALEYLHMMGIVYRDLKPENVLVREDGHIMLSDFDLSLKCDVVPKLLRSKSSFRSTTRNSSSSSSPHACAAPMQSCFSLSLSSSSSRSKSKREGRVTTIIRENVNNAVQKKEEEDGDIEDEDEDDEPELVAEPIDARSKSFVGTHEYLAPEVISGQGHGSAVDWWTFGVFLYEMLYGRTPFKGENNGKTLINILKQPLAFPRIAASSSKEFEEIVRVQDLISKLLVKNPKKRIGSCLGSVEIKRHEFFRGVNWALIRSVKPPHVPAHHMNTKIRSSSGRVLLPKLSKKERDQPYQITHHFDYF